MSALWLLAATPTPSPSPTAQAIGSGSPGFVGFVFTFLLACAAVLLFLSLTRHLRKVSRRAEQQEAEDVGGAADERPDADGSRG